MKCEYTMNFSHRRSPKWTNAIAVAACVLLCPSLTYAAPNAPTKTPPEIAAIFHKANSGQQLSKADFAKLQAWSTAFLNKNTSSASPEKPQPPAPTPVADEQLGIPCSIQVDVEYARDDGKQKDYFHSAASYVATYNALAMLYPSINGTGDYWATLHNPTPSASYFRFEVYAPKGVRNPTGSGSFTKIDMRPGRRFVTTGIFKSTICNLMLITTGKGDALYPSGIISGLGLPVTTVVDYQGTYTFVDSDSDTVHNGIEYHFEQERANAPILSVPFPIESTNKITSQATPLPTMNLSYIHLVSAIKSGDTTSVTGTETFKDVKLKGDIYSGHSTITIKLRPKVQENW